MAIIYSYSTVLPVTDDLILGTDINAAGKPTKNFTIGSVVDLINAGSTGLGAVIKLDNSAKDPITPFANQSAVDFLNVTGTGVFTAGTFTDSAMTIAGGVGTGFTAFTSTAITGTLQTAAQPNITSLGTLTSLIVNTSVTGTAVATTITAPGDDLQIASTKAIVDYHAATPPTADTLANVLIQGNVTGGTDIAVSAADDITFTNTSKILMGTTTADILEIYGDSADSFIIDKSPGALKLQTSLLSVLNEAGTETILSGTAGAAVDLYFNNAKKFETLTGGAQVTGAFEATGSGTFVNILNIGTYSDTSGDVGVAGQILSSTLTGTNWINNNVGDVTGSGTLNTVARWTATGSDLGDGPIVFSSATAAADSTFGGYVKVESASTNGLIVNSTNSASIRGLDIQHSGVSRAVFDFHPDSGEIRIGGITTADEYPVIYSDGIASLTFGLGATPSATFIGNVTVPGTMTADTFETTAGTATWSTTVMTGFTSITSDLFIGPLTGLASSATALAATGSIGFGGEVTLTSATPSAVYTSGGSITFNLDLVNAAVTGQVLTGLPTPAAASITAGDTILSAFGKTQSQINSIANGLQFQGTWDANTNTPTLASGGGEATSGTTDGATTTDKLIDSTANFTATVTIGDKVVNQVDGQTALVSAIDSATVLSIDTDIMLTGEAYTIDNTPFITQGHYYVVSVAGSTSLNGISDWVIGDWVIAGATNVWEKLDGTAVQGTGTDNYLTKWNGTGVSIIVDSGVTDDGSTIKLLNDVELGTAASDTTIVKGPATFDENTRFDKSISIGAAYGVAGQVFTSGGGAGSVNTWTTPTTGTLTGITSGTGIAVNPSAAPSPTVNIDYLGGDNAILSAAAASEPILGTDQIWFNDIATLAPATVNQIKRTPIEDLPLDNYVSWSATGDNQSPAVPIVATTGFTLKFTGGVTAGGAGISTDSVISGDEMTIGLINSGTPSATTFYSGTGAWAVPAGTGVTGSGAQYTLPMFATTTTLGDSMVSQNAGGTAATIAGDATFTGDITINTTTNAGGLTINASDDNGALVINNTDTGGQEWKIQSTGGTSGVGQGKLLIKVGGTETDADMVGFITDASGNDIQMGVGTDTPVSKLSINSNGIPLFAAAAMATTGLTIHNGTSGTAIQIGTYDAGSYNYIQSAYVDDASIARDLRFYNGSINSLTLDTSGAIQFNTYGSGTHTGTETYTLGVDSSGNIIETASSGSGGGIFHGSVAYTGTTPLPLFTLKRATTGQLIFDVYLTSGTTSGTVRKYVVAHPSNTTPVWNQVIALEGTPNFTVAFTNATTSATGDSVLCTITPTATQTVSYTVQVGYDSVNTVTIA